jgi:hypothetical protein
VAKIFWGRSLAMLAVLCLPAAADPGDRDSSSFPASAAARRVYCLVPCPMGVKTWAEEQLEEIRLGGHETREDVSPQSTFLLLSLDTREARSYALDMSEAPRDVGRWGRPVVERPGSVLTNDRSATAFAAMGITPEQLMRAPDTPEIALTVADKIDGLYRTGASYGGKLRAAIWGASGRAPRLDPEAPRDDAPSWVRYRPPVQNDAPDVPTMRFTKRAVRSGYKIALGVAIGVLIWGFIRQGK